MSVYLIKKYTSSSLPDVISIHFTYGIKEYAHYFPNLKLWLHMDDRQPNWRIQSSGKNTGISRREVETENTIFVTFFHVDYAGRCVNGHTHWTYRDLLKYVIRKVIKVKHICKFLSRIDEVDDVRTIFTRLRTWCMCVHISLSVCVCINVMCIYMILCMHVYMHVCMCAYVYYFMPAKFFRRIFFVAIDDLSSNRREGEMGWEWDQVIVWCSKLGGDVGWDVIQDGSDFTRIWG